MNWWIQVVTYQNSSGFVPTTDLKLLELASILALRRRYSTQPTSPFLPICLLPYPNGSAGPAFSFSESGKVKNLMASDSNLSMKSMGTPWLMTLKNPNSSQAFTMSCLESGLDRSMTGIPENVLESLELLL